MPVLVWRSLEGLPALEAFLRHERESRQELAPNRRSHLGCDTGGCRFGKNLSPVERMSRRGFSFEGGAKATTTNGENATGLTENCPDPNLSTGAVMLPCLSPPRGRHRFGRSGFFA
jgi:hypothetical protein